MNIKITGKNGITLKTKDTYIREDISIAVDDSLTSGGATIKTKGGWSGTPVPNTGTVENVYFNTQLTNEEVVNIIESANLSYAVEGMEPILLADNGNSGICLAIMKNGPLCVIVDIYSYNFYFACGDGAAEELGFEGWNTNIIYPLVVNGSAVSDFEGVSVGTQNAQLSALFSTTPFIQKMGESITLSGEYNETAISITENGTTNIQETIVNNKEMPLNINVNVPIPEGYIIPSGSTTITENGTHNVSEYENVEVNVQPSGTINITENGTFDVKNYASAKVNLVTLKTILDYTHSTANMFREQASLPSMDYINYNDTENVRSMNHMFYKCSNLRSVSIFNTSNVINMEYAFYNCGVLNTPIVLDTTNTTNMRYILSGCVYLHSVDISYFNGSQNTEYMLNGCKQLEK